MSQEVVNQRLSEDQSFKRTPVRHTVMSKSIPFHARLTARLAYCFRRAVTSTDRKYFFFFFEERKGARQQGSGGGK